MQVVSPRTVAVPLANSVNANPINIVYSATIASGSVITVAWTSAAKDPGQPGNFDAEIMASTAWPTPTLLAPTSVQTWAGAAGGGTFTYTTVADGTIYIGAFSGGAPTTGGSGVLYGFSVDIAMPGGTACAYGTRPQGGTTSGIIITTALLDILASALGIPPWITVAFDAFVGKVLWGGDLCTSLPPTMPVFTNADFVGGVPNVVDPVSRDKFWTALLAIAWPYFCECTPGPPLSADPIPPLVPSPTKPDAAPAGPIQLACDGMDLCGLLNQLARQLTGMSAQISQLRSDVTLIQRQHVPFAYVPGALHAGLTGAGQFAIQGLIGLAVQVTTIPAASGEEAGDPIARFGLGWVTTGTIDGWRRSTPLRHNPEWIDAVPDDTLVGYSLEPLVVANIQEFAREP